MKFLINITINPSYHCLFFLPDANKWHNNIVFPLICSFLRTSNKSGFERAELLLRCKWQQMATFPEWGKKSTTKIKENHLLLSHTNKLEPIKSSFILFLRNFGNVTRNLVELAEAKCFPQKREKIGNIFKIRDSYQTYSMNHFFLTNWDTFRFLTRLLPSFIS